MTDNNFLGDLQLFSESGEAAAEVSTATGDATQQTAAAAGQQENGQVTTSLTADEEYEALIKGKYKEQHDKRMQNAINKRFRHTKMLEQTVEKNKALREELGRRYSVSSDDPEALLNAVKADRTWLKEKAFAENMTEEQYEQKLEGEAAKAELERIRKNEQRQKLVTSLNQQAQAVKAKYQDDDFDLWATYESDEGFRTMINAGIDVERAYKMFNFDNISARIADRAQNQATRAVVNDIIANGYRPAEAGMNQTTPAPTVQDIRSLSDAEMDALEEQARYGKVITFR